MNPPSENVQPPSLVGALIPLGFMIIMLTWSVVLFGIDAADGPLQVALLMSAVVGAVVAHKNGHSWERLGAEIVKGISLAMSAILILLMVGALIGVWNMSGTIATVVYYGIKYINPTWFYLAAALITGLIGIVTGSSWTTAVTLGVAFVGMAQAIGASPAITAGAVISGAYFGDKMTPLSETTILTPQIVGSNVYALLTSIGFNVVAGDQYIAIVLPARMFMLTFRERGLHPETLATAVENSGTVTSPLIPWNSCGAFMSATLGASTFVYFPYCFFNLINPLLGLIYGFVGNNVQRLEPEAQPPIEALREAQFVDLGK